VAFRTPNGRLDPERRYDAVHPRGSRVDASPASPDGAVSDLWSLPADADARTSHAEDGFVEAWMSALGGAEPVGEPTVRTLTPHEVASDSSGSPRVAAAGVSDNGCPPPRQRGWTGIAVALGVSLIVGLAALVVIAQLVAHGIGGNTGAGSAGPDSRVVVPGPSAACLIMLVKPHPDGTTANVAGTCFMVG
jgi:hypothetical protein